MRSSTSARRPRRRCSRATTFRGRAAMTSSRPPTESTAASPSASGPAGALFEGQVGAHYLLTMLAESDPRGLPGVLVERIELQRAGQGHPLDDVIVRGVTRAGEPAVLEVQVKRTITFAPAEAVFKDVIKQLSVARDMSGFGSARSVRFSPEGSHAAGGQDGPDH